MLRSEHWRGKSFPPLPQTLYRCLLKQGRKWGQGEPAQLEQHPGQGVWPGSSVPPTGTVQMCEQWVTGREAGTWLYSKPLPEISLLPFSLSPLSPRETRGGLYMQTLTDGDTRLQLRQIRKGTQCSRDQLPLCPLGEEHIRCLLGVNNKWIEKKIALRTPYSVYSCQQVVIS